MVGNSRANHRSSNLESAEGIALLYAQYAGRIYRWLARETGSSEVAADLTAETFAIAYLSGRKRRLRLPESEVAWLFSVARNLLLKQRRFERVERRACRRLGIELEIDPPLFDDVDARLAADAHHDALAEALAGLPEDQREMVRRVVLEGESPAEAAEHLGLQAAAARMRLSRALRAMRSHLHERGTL